MNINSEIDGIYLLIPSLNPDSHLTNYLDKLFKEGFSDVLIIDDGSSEEYQTIFDDIENKGCKVIHHEVNKGKGAALKTGFDYLLKNIPNLEGVVTADSDGQHSPEDTVNVAKELRKSKAIILGTRDFNQDNVPFKSRNGNKITTFVFSLLYGKKINDTQTGLRGIPRHYLERCLQLEGDRYDYEIRMLIDAVRSSQQIIEVPIETIYYDNNQQSHFNPIKDSLKIYSIIFEYFFKYSLSSLLSSLIDIGIFTVLTKLVFNNLDASRCILYGTVIARIISSLFNYFINSRKVFKAKNLGFNTIFKYYLLCVVQMFMSWFFVTLIFEQLSWDTSVIKVIVDVCIFIVNYQVQQKWIFN